MKPRKYQSEAVEQTRKHKKGIIHLPTATGKTFIQNLIIDESLKNKQVFVVLAPKIILSNQLYNEIRDILSKNKRDCQYLVVHSGKAEDKFGYDLVYREVSSTTSSTKIKEVYDKACRENVPLIIFGTYDSSERIVQSGIPVEILLCDEAHNIVGTEFNWIRDNDAFEANRKYYFTATLRNTFSNDGMGMNNIEKFGEILYSKTPLEMVLAGEILRPRMHIITQENNDALTDLDKDVHAIIDAFKEHRSVLNIAPKLLVVCKGSEHLNEIVNHPKMESFRAIRRNLKIFDITSAYKPRVNGKEVRREDWLRTLQNLNENDEAIILHIRILTEGIDVPGITGVMVMRDMESGEFLQTLGRATRLHPEDRKKLYSGELIYNELEKFIKPYAWVIIPDYGIIGSDLKMSLTNMVIGLRDYGFNASQDVVIRENKGKSILTPLAGLNVLNSNKKRYEDIFNQVNHEIEAKEETEKFQLDSLRIDIELSKMTNEELIQLILKK